MKYLVDTHIFLWLLFEPEKIPKKQLKLLADPENSIFVSSISFWEISLKYGIGKLKLDNCLPDDLPDAAQKSNIEIAEISSKEPATFHRLPRTAHEDPFDRMIVWQAVCNKLILITRDRHLQQYKKYGLVSV